MFMSTEYKVLQSKSDSCFVRCMKNLYNGQVQLYYLTDAYKSLSALLVNLDSNSFITIIANMLADIVDVKNNGFLSCQNIDISFEKVYVDPATLKVSLVYLPLSRKLFDDYIIFENELRTGLVKLISDTTALSSPKMLQLATDLSDGTLSLEDLYNRIKGGGRQRVTKIGSSTERRGDISRNQNGIAVRLIAMNAPERVEIEITKDEFVIGKNASVVDGVISFNKMISRVHCNLCKPCKTTAEPAV